MGHPRWLREGVIDPDPWRVSRGQSGGATQTPGEVRMGRTRNRPVDRRAGDGNSRPKRIATGVMPPFEGERCEGTIGVESL